MIQKKKLLQFYIEQYTREARKKQKNPPRSSEMAKKIQNLKKSLKNARSSGVNINHLQELHMQIKNVLAYALRKNDEELTRQVNEEYLPALMELDLQCMLSEQREGINGEFLAYLRRAMPGRICRETMFSLYPKFRHHKLKNKVLELVPMRPEMEFPEVRQMDRHFILHIGPTNSGKTYQALERLKKTAKGVYLGPLRLLALEVYEQMHDSKIPCTMRTGQECIEEEDSRVVSSTIEMADFDENFEVAVIDEAQMVADPDRGHSWTKAILGIHAREIHVCMSPAAEQAVLRLIELCGDSWEIRRYERKTALVCEQKAFRFPEDVQSGDALIVFSKKAVLDVSGRLEEQRIKASVIYGSLPPEVRRRQMHLFNKKKTKVVVATDAIGMGLNLPVRRIVFLQDEKYDGTRRRPLQISEIKQIAGRAGRFGLYRTGYVNAMGEEELEFIRAGLDSSEPQIQEVNLGFPQILLDIDAPLDEVMKVWHDVAPQPPFVKVNIDEPLFLYELAKKWRNHIVDFDNKHILYKMITCPIDIKDRHVVNLWIDYCKNYTADVSLEKPVIRRGWEGGIQKYETYYKQLDLYYQFSHRMQKVIDEEWLEKEREQTEASIQRYLTKGKSDYITRCRYCGKPLLIGAQYQVCEDCFQKK